MVKQILEIFGSHSDHIRCTARGDVSVLAFCKWRSLVAIVLQDVKDALLASQVTRVHFDVGSWDMLGCQKPLDFIIFIGFP